MTHATEQRDGGQNPAKRRRIPWAITFFVCAVVGILLLLLLLVWGGGRPEDSDLILVSRNVGRENNGYWLLVDLPGLGKVTECKTLEDVLKAEGVPVDSDDWDNLVDELHTDFWVWDFRASESWPDLLPLKGAPRRAEHPDLRELRQDAVRWKRVEAYVDALLKRASVALARLNEALARRDLVLPSSPPHSPVVAYRSLDQLGSWFALARRVRFSATRHFNTGDVDAAIEGCHRLITFGRRVARSQAGTYGLAVGTDIEGMGAAQLVQIACVADLPPKRLREIVRAIAPPDDLVDAYAREIRAEYTRLVSWVDNPDQLGIVDSPSPGILFSPNRVLRRAAKAYRALLEVRDRPTNPEPEAWAGAWEKDRDPVSIWLDTVESDLSWAVRNNCSMYRASLWEFVGRTRIRMTLVAVKMHILEQGKLPKSLDDLIPRYLDEMPLDPFDGKPFRLSPTTRCVYASRRGDPGMRDIEQDYPSSFNASCGDEFSAWIEDYIPDIPPRKVEREHP